jgi:ABC-type branched-subunit amino acid transport system ATPase component
MKAVLSLAERVAVLDFGRLLTSGDPQVVMRDPAVVKAYLGGKAFPDA